MRVDKHISSTNDGGETLLELHEDAFELETVALGKTEVDEHLVHGSVRHVDDVHLESEQRLTSVACHYCELALSGVDVADS